MVQILKRLCKSPLEPESKCKKIESLIETSSQQNPHSVRRLRRVDIGKRVPNHYKPEFEFSNFVSFLYLFCAYIVVWKKILKNPIHPPFQVFSLIIHSLCFIILFVVLRKKIILCFFVVKYIFLIFFLNNKKMISKTVTK